jgi:hypothetical protein
VGLLRSAGHRLSQLNNGPCSQRTLPEMGGFVADLDTQLGTDHGCWLAQCRRASNVTAWATPLADLRICGQRR